MQNEPSVSDLRRGHAVWDGERVVDEEALRLGKVRDVVSCVSMCVCVPVTVAQKRHRD